MWKHYLPLTVFLLLSVLPPFKKELVTQLFYGAELSGPLKALRHCEPLNFVLVKHNSWGNGLLRSFRANISIGKNHFKVNDT